MKYISKIKDVGKELLLVVLYLFISIALQLIFYNFLTSKNFLLCNLSYLLMELIILIIFLFLFRRIIIPKFKDFKTNFKKYCSKYFLYWVIGVLIMIASTTVISFFAGMAENEELNRQFLTQIPIYSIFSIIISGPIVEELLTRVILKDTFKHQIIYIILSGLIFGSLHLLNSESLLDLLYVIPYGALGCAFAKMYYDSNNIWVNITFHSFHNLICLLLILVGA